MAEPEVGDKGELQLYGARYLKVFLSLNKDMLSYYLNERVSFDILPLLQCCLDHQLLTRTLQPPGTGMAVLLAVKSRKRKPKAR